MKLTALIASSLLLAGLAFSQEQTPVSEDVTLAPTGKVTISSKGSDVRSVLYDLFSQAGRSFVLEPNVRQILYLHLKDVEFDEALAIVLKSTSLKVEKQNGIAFISALKPGEAPARTAVAPAGPAPAAPKTLGKLTPADLQRKLTTRFKVTDLATVLKDFGRQTGVTVDLAPDLPKVKIDAFLIDTSLKFALDSVCDAVGLRYVLTEDRGIRIEKKA